MTDIPTVATNHWGRCLVASFTGVMDRTTAPMFRTEFLNLLDSGERLVVLDLSGVHFCDADGVNALVAAHRHAAETGATLVLACLREQPRHYLEFTCADQVFRVYETVVGAKTAIAC
ncbi:STAS domain-containing protein [Streptomyces griseosporeus]|uniref:STAS domain-containing protein n=1 Tax=Streptomyces griseosporeus TaxID=1910 RepID=UPI0036FE0838